MYYICLNMSADYTTETRIQQYEITSFYLQRDVKVDCYLHPSYNSGKNLSLLLINDGQDLRTMKFEEILDDLNNEDELQPVMCIGIHCASDRKNEYGTAKVLDYKGRGGKAFLYTHFVFKELLPFIRKEFNISSFKEKAFAGFSLGGLCALDIVWNYPQEFSKVGVFSGSLWWRDMAQDDVDFNEDEHRIMQRQVREGGYFPWLKFFFEVGILDETADRNKNGIIDSIDDTQAVIGELEKKGYQLKRDINYLELKDGKHDVQTWARAFPVFLKWAFGIES